MIKTRGLSVFLTLLAKQHELERERNSRSNPSSNPDKTNERNTQPEILKKSHDYKKLSLEEISSFDLLRSARSIFKSSTQLTNELRNKAIAELLPICIEMTNVLGQVEPIRGQRTRDGLTRGMLTRSAPSMGRVLDCGLESPNMLTQSGTILSSTIVRDKYQHLFDEKAVFRSENPSANNYTQLMTELNSLKEAILKNELPSMNRKVRKELFIYQIGKLIGSQANRIDEELLSTLYDKSPCHWVVFILAAQADPTDRETLFRVLNANDVQLEYCHLFAENKINSYSQPAKQNSCQL